MFSSVAQLCPTLCNPMDCSTPGLPVHHHLLEFTQTHIHRVGDAFSPSIFPFSSHLRSFPESWSFPMSQFFTSSGQSIEVSAPVSVLPENIQDRFPLRLSGLISLHSKGLSTVFSNCSKASILQHSAFFMVPTRTSIHDFWKNHNFD